jgi:hypothetical protein
MSIKVWLDDLRDPVTFGNEAVFPASIARDILNIYGRDWVWIKTVEEAMEIISNNEVSMLSCDNDLGEGMTEGYKLLDWLEEKVFTNDKLHIPEIIFAHSENASARDRMFVTIMRIEELQYQ